MAKNKINPKAGDLFEIPLSDGRLGFGQILCTTMVGFFAVASDRRLPVEEIVQKDVAFRIICMHDQLRSGRWPIFGNAPLPPAMRALHRMWRKPAGGSFELSEWTPETSRQERPATLEEVKGLEKHGIWDSVTAVVRLEKFLRGEPMLNLHIA
jgi:hypothetical protein